MLSVVILAGGRASRMGGGDKPLLELGGVPILSHVLARVARSGRNLAINANGDPERFRRFGLPVLPDSETGFPGPLAGILAGLDWTHAEGRGGFVLSVPGDCPFIPHDLVEALQRAREAGSAVMACAESGGRMHPVVALWPVEARDVLRAALQQGHRKVERMVETFGCATANWPDSPVDPFFNVNTPEDLARAESLLPTARTT